MQTRFVANHHLSSLRVKQHGRQKVKVYQHKDKESVKTLAATVDKQISKKMYATTFTDNKWSKYSWKALKRSTDENHKSKNMEALVN